MRIALVVLLVTCSLEAQEDGFLEALAELARALPDEGHVDGESFALFEAKIRATGTFLPPPSDVLTVDLPDAPQLAVHLAWPEGYDGTKPTPLVLAFGGGPIPVGDRGDRMTARQADMMRSVWQPAATAAGWIVAAVRDSISRSRPGVRYEIVRPQQIEAVVIALRQYLNVDDDRVFMTGVSLGSNYSIACGASRPQLFCGAAPVSTEGETRAPLLRNLRNYPLYVLEGTRDRNIRAIEGPRMMHDILDELGYVNAYEEYPDRGHESFGERYPDVLKWFAERPRRFWASEVVRVPHDGIMAPGRRFYWISCDTRQGIFRARVAENTIEIEVARATRLDLLLSDQLVDLDEPVRVVVNGEVVHDARRRRDPRLAIGHVSRTRDRRQVPAARVVVDVPTTRAAQRLAAGFAASMNEIRSKRPPLAYWEDYALRHLRETRRLLGVQGKPEQLGDGRFGLRVQSFVAGSAAQLAGLRAGDLIVAFDGNPFFAGDDASALLDLWCLREQYGGRGPSLLVQPVNGAARTIRVVLRSKSRPYR